MEMKMIHIFQNIYCGNENDAYQVLNSDDWAILHCCKNPFHKRMVGYKGNLPPNHPDYKYKINGRRMALNLVDMDTFSTNFVEFNHDMFKAAFCFLDSFQGKHNILIHCNQGESRGPSLTMLYLKHLAYFDEKDFSKAFNEFKLLYPNYRPKLNIFKNIEILWNRF